MEAASEAARMGGGLLDDWMTRDELAEALGVSVDTLGRWQTQGIGPACVRIGRRILYRKEAVQQWLVEREDQATRISGIRRGQGPVRPRR